MAQVKESKATLVTIPINVLSMLESVKEETLDPKIEDENDNSSYIENTEYNSEMEIKYETLICYESLSDSVAGEQTLKPNSTRPTPSLSPLLMALLPARPRVSAMLREMEIGLLYSYHVCFDNRPLFDLFTPALNPLEVA